MRKRGENNFRHFLQAINRKYKDALFRFIFTNKDKLLSLYNALNGSHYTNAEHLQILTKENVIYMQMKEDVSFLISNTLNLYEHQATWNPNMPFPFRTSRLL